MIDRYEIGERQTRPARRRRSGWRTSACMASVRQTFDELVIHTPARRSAGGCRGRSRRSTTASCARCCAPRATRIRDGQGRGPDRVHRPHRPRRPARAADRRRARLAPRAEQRADDPAAERAAFARPGGPPPRRQRRPRDLDRPQVHPRGLLVVVPGRRRAARRRRLVPPARPRQGADGAAWPATSASTPVRYQGNWIPHQLRDAVEDGDLLRRRQRRATACRRPPRASAPPSTSGWRCGRELRKVIEGRQTREQALARYGSFSDDHLGSSAGCCACRTSSAA